MRIRFVQSGGFAGLRRVATLDTGALPPKQARELEALVDRSGFFELPEKLRAPGADRFQYTVTVESADRQHTVQVTDGAVPPELQALLDTLRDAAQPEPLKPATGTPERR